MGPRTDSVSEPLTTARSAPRIFGITFTLTLLWSLSGLLVPAAGFLFRHSSGKILSSIEIDDLLGGRLSLQLLTYVAGFILVLVVFAWLISSTARLLGDRLRLSGHGTLLLALGIWTTSVGLIQLLNDRLYPRSRAGFFDPAFAASTGAEWLLYLMGTAILLVTVFAATLYLRQRTPPRPVLLLVPIGLLLAGLVSFAAPRTEPLGPTTGRPNVILVGIDSLRTDRVSPDAQETGATPHISRFLGDAAVFTQTYTPLARTYPAWMSILTGQYPRTNGVRYNLTPMSSVARESSIAWQFREQGYDTILAMDERRFANIDAKHGFDTEIGPDMGAGDFLFASVTDTPLTNLLHDTPIGRHLFAFNHLNRAVDRLYHPDRFDRALATRIANRPASRPLFLVAHFCLPHWPYRWAEPTTHNDTTETGRILDYGRAVAVADAQFGHLMAALEQAGALENAIVVLLSDHGESLGESLGEALGKTATRARRARATRRSPGCLDQSPGAMGPTSSAMKNRGCSSRSRGMATIAGSTAAASGRRSP